VPFESVVITEQRERWLAAGSPPVPTLVIGDTPHVLQHPSQAALLLGLEAPPALRDAGRVAWDIDSLMAAWVELCTATPWAALTERIPGFGRSPLALAVDASVGIQALLEPFSSGWFHWPGNPETGETGDRSVVEYEASIVAGIETRGHLLAFVEPVAARWRAFVAANDEAFGADPARELRTPRGPLTWVELLEAQRLHCAQHYRQATTRLVSLGLATPPIELETLYGLRLPASVY
jgi:hypothetical protein